ncbi:hypothetical protein ARMGADRAFT_1013737 [Armillaria gallica]|uniref:Uncharacterized protein n=1 Tax=Armillaria gallica TaxID=47427 RepID=A0A2H3D9U0_ARMGA|nr:hypothetical protein ARMGADRAFT_1013737 [Armillaria gallica]
MRHGSFLTQFSSRRGGPLSQTPTYTTTLPLGPFFSDADLFFRARNSTVVTRLSANVSILRQRTIAFPKNRKFRSCPDPPESHPSTHRIAELEVVVVALKGIQVKHR